MPEEHFVKRSKSLLLLTCFVMMICKIKKLIWKTKADAMSCIKIMNSSIIVTVSSMKYDTFFNTDSYSSHNDLVLINKKKNQSRV